MDAWIHACMYGYMHACMYGLWYGCMDVWMLGYMHACMDVCMDGCMHGYGMDMWIGAKLHQTKLAINTLYLCLKLIAFELAAKFSRRRENPVQPRLCNAKNAIFKRLKTGFSLRSRSSPANSNAISFINLYAWRRNDLFTKLCRYMYLCT
jgi:hypothetical protein